MITIVIVEDQGILRESLACTLNLQEDMQVARALSDAADALDVVRETNANLALLDVCTENGSSGIAAAKQIREACPDTKIVIMTGMPEITFIEQAKLAGADSFVYKNVGTEELLGNYSLNRQRLLHLPECNPEYLLGRFGTQRNRDQHLAIGLRSKNA